MFDWVLNVPLLGLVGNSCSFVSHAKDELFELIYFIVNPQVLFGDKPLWKIKSACDLNMVSRPLETLFKYLKFSFRFEVFISWLVFPFLYHLKKPQKTFNFLVFSGVIKCEHSQKWVHKCSSFRSSRCSWEFRNIHRKTPSLEFLFDKVAILRPATLLKGD